MRFEVVLTHDAERDLEELYDFISESDSPISADRVLERLFDVTETLASHPERGSSPQELRALGMHEYRQVFFKPYRVIYRISDKRVLIYLVVDGRGDMQSLLSRRILRG
jgi:toxin ParE1/3/4